MLTVPRTKQIDLRLDADVMHITLSRPEIRNAISAEMLSELADAFSTLDDVGARAVVLRGAGGNFCAGGDLKEMSSLLKQVQDNDRAGIARHNALAGNLFHTINNAPQAVIAVLEGAVIGGGIGLACAADIAIALRSARFGLPETGLGLVPAQIAPFLRRRVGESQARLLAVTGGQIDAETAERIGLVHYLVDDEKELQCTLAEALRKINDCAPEALAVAKQLMFEPGSLESVKPERLGIVFARAMSSAEAAEGIAAFLEKRKPKWR